MPACIFLVCKLQHGKMYWIDVFSVQAESPTMLGASTLKINCGPHIYSGRCRLKKWCTPIMIQHSTAAILFSSPIDQGLELHGRASALCAVWCSG